MDEQNWMEKLGILKELNDIKLQLAELRGSVKGLTDVKDQTHQDIKNILNKHENLLEGAGMDPGVRVNVDRLLQSAKDLEKMQATRHAHFLVIYGAILTLIVNAVLQWLSKHP